MRARQVWVWLGLAFEGSDAAVSFIAKTARATKDVKHVWKVKPPTKQRIEQGVHEHITALVKIINAP